MKISQEADYALRIAYILASDDAVCDAACVAVRAGITQSLSLKILRKLSLAGIVSSVRGPRGGYAIRKDGQEASMLDVIRAVDGDPVISACLCEDYVCSRMKLARDSCSFHKIFEALNLEIVRKAARVKIADVAKGVCVAELLNDN